MISDRANALLQAAAAIYGGCWANPTPGSIDKGQCVEDAYDLLVAIEAREKANAPTSKPLPCRHERLDAENCPWCRGSL